MVPLAFACSLCVGLLLTPICLSSPLPALFLLRHSVLRGVCVLRAPPGPHHHLSSCAAGLPASLCSPACPRSWFLCCHCAVSGSHSSEVGAVSWLLCRRVLCSSLCILHSNFRKKVLLLPLYYHQGHGGSEVTEELLGSAFTCRPVFTHSR